nr:mRNA-capping enzyme-like isoform X2 [Tanacetum cinerariifolium]
ESYGETSCSKLSYDIPYKNISLDMARPIKGRKSSSSILVEENHITRCSSHRAWFTAMEPKCKAKYYLNVMFMMQRIFSNGRNMLTKQGEPIFPKDPTLDMAKISKRIHGSQNGSYVPNSLSKGWSHCPPYRDALSFIIPSKVPLKESFIDKIIIHKRYSPQQAILQQRRLERELGLVIDLTNTDRYYQESDWMTSEGSIVYVKLRCVGKESVPITSSSKNLFKW